MRMIGNTILITGGATGIGLAFAEAFLEAGNEVIVCARTEDHLTKAKERLPALHIRSCDLSKENERRDLHDWLISNFPETNVLVNNAGIQRMIDFKKGSVDLDRYRETDGEDEIEINLRTPVTKARYTSRPRTRARKGRWIRRASLQQTEYPRLACCTTPSFIQTPVQIV